MIRLVGGVRGASEPGTPASAQPPGVGSGQPAGEPAGPRVQPGLEGPPGSTRRQAQPRGAGQGTDPLDRVARGLRRPHQAAVRDALAVASGSRREHPARILRAFAAALRQHPAAGHEERARLLAGVILELEPAGALLRGRGGEQHRERLLEVVAAELAGSPELSMLVDEVTAGARGGRRG